MPTLSRPDTARPSTLTLAAAPTNQEVGSSNLSGRANLAFVYSEDMGNFSGEGVGRALDPTALIVEEAEVVVHEADEPDVVSDFPHADVLSRKDLTEVDLGSSEAQSPRCAAKSPRRVKWTMQTAALAKARLLKRAGRSRDIRC